MKNLTIDQFAVFMADIIKSVDCHNFDAFYDIARIVKLKNQKYETKEPIKENFYLCTRNTGIDLISTVDENKEIYLKNNSTHYLITFCWNCDYFYKESFAIIQKIK